MYFSSDDEDLVQRQDREIQSGDGVSSVCRGLWWMWRLPGKCRQIMIDGGGKGTWVDVLHRCCRDGGLTISAEPKRTNLNRKYGGKGGKFGYKYWF